MEDKKDFKVNVNINDTLNASAPQKVDNTSIVKTSEYKANMPQVSDENIVSNVIIQNAKSSTNVKDVIDLASTSKALENQKTVDKLVDEKTEELINDAMAKKVEAETKKIKEEVSKVKQQAEKEIAELNKSIANKRAEIEELQALDNKAQAYFDANKSILRCVGIREKLSLSAMQFWMWPASFIYALFQIILFPFTLVGFAAEQLMGIIEAVCGKIAKGGWKIVITILVSAVIAALIGGIYYVVTRYVTNLI